MTHGLTQGIHTFAVRLIHQELTENLSLLNSSQGSLAILSAAREVLICHSQHTSTDISAAEQVYYAGAENNRC